jgi:rod shape-determining protein MreC
MVVLSAGSNEGVVERAPVVVAGGLAGVVHSVTRRSSVALLWTHPEFRVSAMAADGSVFGIVAPRRVEGPNTMMLELSGVPYQERVPLGTMIYTSGLGGARGVYPRGIPIGQIVAIGEEQEGWSRTYVVQPAVHPASLSHVVVLTGPAIDLREAFTEYVP